MRKFLLIALLLALGSVTNAQNVQKGDTCANCTRSSNSDRDAADQRAQDLAKRNEWPVRPEVKRSAPLNFRVFKTNFLVNNESDKEIREIKWTATLINRETQVSIGTFPLQTKKKIGPHKSSHLKEKVVVPLKKLVGSTVSANKPTDPTKPVEVDEKYDILEIVYKDKSVTRP